MLKQRCVHFLTHGHILSSCGLLCTTPQRKRIIHSSTVRVYTHTHTLSLQIWICACNIRINIEVVMENFTSAKISFTRNENLL
eukprot:UN12976